MIIETEFLLLWLCWVILEGTLEIWKTISAMIDIFIYHNVFKMVVEKEGIGWQHKHT